MIRNAFIAIATLWFCGAAQAASCPTVITQPCEITQDGSYLLGADLDGVSLPHDFAFGSQKPVIHIIGGVTSATINCNGYQIVNSGDYQGRGVGIGGKLVANITVQNCEFSGNGMMACLWFDNQANWNFNNITVQNIACQGTLRGVFIRSVNTRVEDSYFANVGGQHIWCSYPTNGIPEAIEVQGHNSVITRNKIKRVWDRCKLESVGIAISHHCNNTEVSENVIENDRLGVGSSWGIWIGGCFGMTIRDNVLTNWHKGMGAGYVASGVIEGNVMTNVTTPYTGLEPPNWVINDPS